MRKSNRKIINILLSAHKKAAKAGQDELTVCVDKQKKRLARFAEPKDLSENSFYQYKCQAYMSGWFINFLKNAVAFFLYGMIKKKIAANGYYPMPTDKKRAIYFSTTHPLKNIPLSLQNEFEEIHDVENGNNEMAMDEFDLAFIKAIEKKYKRRSAYFCLKILLRIALFSYQIKKHSPKAVISCCEYSFSSSVLTEYCRQKKIEHINIMHGEQFYSINNAFAAFDKFFVWDEYYKQIYIELRQQVPIFIVEQPELLFLQIKSIEKHEMTYYLSFERKKDLIKIKESLRQTGIEAKKICIRFHPRFGNRDDVLAIMPEFIVEDPKKITLEESLSSTKNCVSLNSTVLYIADLNGKKVTIDDCSNPKKFEIIRKAGYIMLNKNHSLLSEYKKAKQIH